MSARLFSLLCVLLLLASPSAAQVKQIEPGSNDNRFQVTVRNPDSGHSIEHIAVRVLSRPDWLTSISVQYDSDSPLGPGQSRLYTVYFSVADDAPAGAGAYLQLDISSRSDVLLDAPKIRIPLRVRQLEAAGQSQTATVVQPAPAARTDPDPDDEAAPEASAVPAPSTEAAGEEQGVSEPAADMQDSDSADMPEVADGQQVSGENEGSGIPAGVPNVVGMDIREAHGIISAAGLTPALEVGPDAPSSEQVNTVARQSVGPDGEIILVIYGEVSIPGRKVPALVGLPFVQAEDLLAKRDLFADVEIDQEPDYPEQASTVYRQYPEPGLEVPRGTGIRLWVYAEPPPETSQAEPSQQAEPEKTSKKSDASTSQASSASEKPSKSAGANGSSGTGIAALEIPRTIGAYSLQDVKLCENGRYTYSLGAQSRIERPGNGFACDAERGINLFYTYGNALATQVMLRWLEPGDSGAKGSYCRGENFVNQDPIISARNYTADRPDVSVSVYVTANLYELQFRLPANQRQMQVDALDQFVEDIMAAVAPIAARCP